MCGTWGAHRNRRRSPRRSPGNADRAMPGRRCRSASGGVVVGEEMSGECRAIVSERRSRCGSVRRPSFPKRSRGAGSPGALSLDEPVWNAVLARSMMSRTKCTSKTTTPGPSARARISSVCSSRRSACRHRLGGVHQDASSDVIGERVVGEVGAGGYQRAEVVEIAVGRLDPRPVRGVRGSCHAR